MLVNVIWSPDGVISLWPGQVHRVVLPSWLGQTEFLPPHTCLYFGGSYFCGGDLTCVAKTGRRGVGSLFRAIVVACLIWHRKRACG